MISGENSIVTNVLKNAVSSSILAGSRRVSEKNRQKAVDYEIELLKHHQKTGQQTPQELIRSNKTIALITNEHRRWNEARGYFSVAPVTVKL